MANVSKVVIAEVVEEIKIKAEEKAENFPKEAKDLPKLSAQLKKIKDGVEGLHSLDEDFQNTLRKLLTYANEKITDDMKISEWTQIMKGIVEMHGMMYGKGGGSVVNIVNNQQNNSASVEAFKVGLRS